jgi:flagellar hook-associated protein 3 FlgL
MIRTTFLSTSLGAQNRLMNRSAAMEQASARLSSGRAWTRPSEDPGAASTSLSLRSELSALKSYESVAGDAQSRLDVTDSQLSDVNSLIARLKELAVGAATGTMNNEGRAATAQEVGQIRDQLVSLANARHLDQPVFAGYSSANAVSQVSGAWTFTGTPSEAIMRSVSDTDSVQVNVVASDIFQAKTTDAFTMLDTFVNDLKTNNGTGIKAAVDEMDTFRTNVTTARARIGAATNRVETVLAGNRTRQTEAITDVNRQQAAYEAALGATAKSLQQSLVDFLR